MAWKDNFDGDGDYLRINIDLKSMVFAEELTIECSDGVERKGVFIPYEPNGMYVKNEKAYANFNAFKTTNKYKFKFKSPSSHVILPYWSSKHVERMKQLGYTRQDRFQGFIQKVTRLPKQR